MRTNKNLLLLLAFSALISSCISNKKFVLFQNAKVSNNNDSAKSDYQLDKGIYKLQIHDILYISLNITSQEGMITQTFSHPSGNEQIQQGNSVGNQFYFTGYSLDALGEINLPAIGKLKVAGLSISEAKEKIEIELSKFFKVYHLIVKLNEIPFTLLGEVTRPGRYSGIINQITLSEALALAGDFTPIANRRKITIIRQNADGMKVYNVDFTQADILKNPCYLIRPNDLIYVEPLKSRAFGNFSSVQSSLQTLTPILTVLVLSVNTYILIRR